MLQTTSKSLHRFPEARFSTILTRTIDGIGMTDYKVMDRANLQSIVHFCDKAMSYTKAVSRDGFLDSMMIRDACATNCIAIGYRAERLSESLTGEYGDVDWENLWRSGKQIEELYGTPFYDDEVLWNLVSGGLPIVRDYCQKILEGMEGQ